MTQTVSQGIRRKTLNSRKANKLMEVEDMKVKELVNKIRLIGTPVKFFENGKLVNQATSEVLAKYQDGAIMNRTVNTFEVHDSTITIWLKPEQK
jgi:rRNA pseudouridine-1189 N-methylase Emg1 (Nep1/Mra1 family)